jgi:c-di-GMP-binding flagellar brake protein YcgR
MSLDRRRAERERRQSRRVAAVFAVRNGAGRSAMLGQVEDIGPAGMMLRWPRDAVLRPGAVALSFVLPGSEQPIEARAMVVSERRNGRFHRTGVRFTALEPHHAAMIARYCASRGV